MLIIPELFSNRGRVAVLAYAYILVMSGPTKNAMRNANILIESMNCGQELLTNQTKAIMKSIFAPLLQIIQTMRDILEALKDLARQLKEAFMAIRDLFLEIIDAIKRMFSWILSIVKVCSNKYGSPYKRCNKAFDDAIADCEYRLGFFKFMCYIVKIVQYICELARIVDLLCAIPRAIKTGIIEPIKAQVKKFTQYMYNQFYVNVTLVHFYNYTFEQSKSFEEIRGDINEEIKQRTAWFNNFIDWTDLAMTFFILALCFKAFIYRIRYLTADHFDNTYITYLVRDIDNRRSDMDKETILPLTMREKTKYVNTFSFLMGKKERKKLMASLTVLIISGAQMAFYIMLDYSLYNLLKLIQVHGKVQAKGGVPSHVTMNVKGKGVLADMYRQVISAFDPIMSGVLPDFDSTICLPEPVPIDIDCYQEIGILYTTSFVLSLTESYGLRMRHVICGIFYPARERARAVWLYNHILKTRGGLVKFLRRKIRRAYFGDDTVEKISLLDRWCNQSPLFGRLMKAFGYIRIYCLCCNEAGKPENSEKFRRCVTSGCKGVYCLPCFEDINNVCTLCMKPVEYGDLSDMSEEVDSSEEEEDTEEKLRELLESSSNTDDEETIIDMEESRESVDLNPPKRKKELAKVSDLDRKVAP